MVQEDKAKAFLSMNYDIHVEHTEVRAVHACHHELLKKGS